MAETTTPRKSGGPSNAILIAAIVLGLAGMAIMNSISQRLDPAEIEKREKEAEEKKAAEAAQKAQETQKPSSDPADADKNALVGLGDDKILGKPDGKTEVLIVWSWTPEVQADPSKVWKAVQAAQTGAPDAKIRVVNADAKPDMTPGVFINGRQVLPVQPDGALPAVPDAYRQMSSPGAAALPTPKPLAPALQPAGLEGVTPAPTAPTPAAPGPAANAPSTP